MFGKRKVTPDSKSGNQTQGSLQPSRIKKGKNQIDAPLVDLIASEDGELVLAMGMRWRTLVQASAHAQSVKMAHKAKANGMILKDHQLGYGIFDNKPSTHVVPAALLAAKECVGTGLFLLVLAPNQYWLALVRNGQPTANDRLINGLDVVQVIEQARSLIESLEIGDIPVYTDIPHAAFSVIMPYSVADLFLLPHDNSDRIEFIGSSGTTLPKPVLIGLVLLTVFGVGQIAWDQYQTHLKDLAASASKMNMKTEATPEEAWAPVMQKFNQETAHPGAPIDVIRNSISEVPVLWAGWKMEGVRCEAAAKLLGEGENKNRSWACTASYLRGPAGVTSAEMQQVIKIWKPDASAAFPRITSMVVTWGLMQTGMSLQPDRLPVANEIQLAMMSQLQNYLTALTEQPSLAFVALEMGPAPKKQDGTAQPLPADYVPLLNSEIAIKGPLRSIDVVWPTLPVEWTALGVVPGVESSAQERGITNSNIKAELSGRVLARSRAALMQAATPVATQ